MSSAYQRALAYANEDASAKGALVEAEPDGIGESLRKGVSSGVYGAGSQLQSVAGMAGELVGADEFAQNRYADANALRQQARGMAPQINQWDQVHGLGDTLRYGAGMVGSSLPVSLAAMGAGALTGGGALPAMAAAGAVTAPFEMGDVIQKQQDSPEAMQQSLGERATGAVLGGLGSAAFQGVVPGIIGKQLTRGATGAVRQGTKGAYAKNVLGDFALEAGAEGGGDIIKQTGANPDAAIDWDSVKENMIGGGIAGGAMGHIGFAADMAHNVAPGARDMFNSAKDAVGEHLTSAKEYAGGKLDDAAETAPGKKVKSVFEDFGDMLNQAKTKVDSTVDKVMKGEELGDPKEWLGAATDAAKKRMMDISDDERVKAATAWAKEMLDDVGLDEAKRNDIADALGNIKDRTSQMFVASAKKAWDASKKTKSKIDEFTEAVREGYEEGKRADVDVDATWVDEDPTAPSTPGEPTGPITPSTPGEPTQGQLRIGGYTIPESVRKAFEGDPEGMKEITDILEEKPKPTINQRKAFIDARKAEGMTDAQARAAFIESLNPKKSEDYSGANAAIHNALVESGLSKRRPDLFEDNKSINKMADTLRMIGEQIPKGPLKQKVLNKFIDVFGADSLDVLDSITKALGGNKLDSTAVEKTFAAINRVDKAQKQRGGLQSELTAMVADGVQDSVLTTDMPRVIDNLIAHARGETTKGMDPRSEQAKAINTRAASLMQQMFGEHADAASDLIVKAAKQTRDGAPKVEDIDGEDAIGKQEVLDEYGNDVATYTNEYQDEGAPAFDEQGNRLEGSQKHKVRYGLTPPDKAGNSKSVTNGRAMQEGSQYQIQHKLDLERQYSTLDAKGNVVRTHEQNGYSIYFEPLARTGATDPSAKGATGEDGRATVRTRADNSDVTVTDAKGNVSVQPGKRFGHIIVENHGNPHEFSAEDLQAMKYDSERDPDGPSKLKVGKYSIDAVRVAKVARNKMQDRFESETPMNYVQRLVDGFKQGIAMLSEQHNERINVPGAAIIGYVYGAKGATPLTWAQAQKMAKDPRTMSDKEADEAARVRDARINEVHGKLKVYRQAFKDAKAEGTPVRVLDAIVRTAKKLQEQLRIDLDAADYNKTEELANDPNEVSNAKAKAFKKSFVEPDYAEISRATAAGATIYTDSHAHRRRAYNVGERKVARHLREQGYNEYEPGVWTRDGAEPTSDGGTGFTLTTRNEYTAKDQRKADYATHYIGTGRKGSATSDYARDAADQGIPVNAGKYTDKDHVFISANGQDGAAIKRGDGAFAYDNKGDSRFDENTGMLTKGGANEVLQGNYHGGINQKGSTSRMEQDDRDKQARIELYTGDEGFNSGQGRREMGNDENIHLAAALQGDDSPLYANGRAIGTPPGRDKPRPIHPAKTPLFQMNYADGQSVVGKGKLAMRPEFRGKSTMDLILEGKRTATTGTIGRFNGAKMGDVVMATDGRGTQALIRFTSDPYPVASMDAEQWSQLEGWAPETLEKYRTAHSNDFQMTFELINERGEPIYGDGITNPTDLKTGQELMADRRNTAGGLDRGRSNMDGSGHWVDPRTDSGLTGVVDLVHSWSDKTVTSQRIKRRALVLVDNYYKMSKRDQQRFRELAPNAEGRVESSVTYADKHVANATLKSTLKDMTEQQLRMELRRREKLMDKGVRDRESQFLIEEEADLIRARLESGKYGEGLKGTVSAGDAQGLINELARKYMDTIVVPGVGEHETTQLKRGFVDAGQKDVVPEVTGSSGAENQKGVVVNGGREAVLRKGKQRALEDAFGVTPPTPAPYPRSVDGGRVPDQRAKPGKGAVNARDNMTKATPEQLEALVTEKGKPRPKAQAPAQGAIYGSGVGGRLGDIADWLVASRASYPKTVALNSFLGDTVKNGMTRSQILLSPIYRAAMREIDTSEANGDKTAGMFRSSILNTIDQLTSLTGDPDNTRRITKLIKTGRADLGQVMDAIKPKHEATAWRAIAEGIKATAGGTPIRFATIPEGYNGAFRPEINEIHISPTALPSVTWLAMHEGVHAATVRALHENPELQRQLYTLMEHVGGQDKSLISAYGMTNTLEFLAEGLSNSGFQSKLGAISAHAGVAKYLGQNVANAWGQFVSLVRQALGIPAHAENAFTQLLELSGMAMKETAGHTHALFDISGIFARGTIPAKDVLDAIDRITRVSGNQVFDDIKKNPSIDGQAYLPHFIGLAIEAIEQSPTLISHIQQAVSIDDIEQVVGGVIQRMGSYGLAAKVGEKQSAITNAAKQGDRALLQELSEATDAASLKRGIDALIAGAPESEALGVANDRMAELLLDEDVAYGMGTKRSAEATNPNTKANNPQTSKDVRAYVEKVLGKSVKLAWAKFTHAGEFRRTSAGDLIRLSVHALDPMSTAYHESLHAFFAQLRDAGAHDVIKVVEATAQSPAVMKQIREFYKNQPEVLKQLADPEERAAYMYQMWANGKLTVSTKATTTFQKIAAFIRELLGMWSNDERALHIMDYFSSGDYAKLMGTPNAMKRVLMEPGRNKAVETAKAFTEPLARLADTIIGSGSARLEDTEIPALAKLARLVKRSHLEEGGDQGYIPAARIEATKRLGVMADLLGGYPQPVLNDALEALQTGLPAYSAEGRAAVTQVKAILAGTYRYMTDAGVKIGNLGPDYFPRVWDTDYVSKNEQALRDMLEPYVRSGEFKGNPTDFIRSLTSRDGNEFGIETSSPGMQHKKTRVMDFLKPEDVAPFLNKDLLGTLASYITQAARKAEWERRFGYDANNPDATKLETIFEEAKQQGATREQLQVAEQYLKGVDGTLGDTIDPGVRRMMGNMVVYQNIRLLPMAAFSMVVDPLGVMVRGGTLTQAYSTFKRGVASIRGTYGGKVVDDEATQLAEMVGVVDKAVLSSVMSDLYTQGMVGGTMKKVNDAFFKYNMVEGMNRAFRVGASEAAMSFLAKHADLKASPHSARWMAELGLKAGDIKAGPNGRIALHRSEGLTLRQEKRVHAAINQWVDGAMLRPDAADKPIWMNDPRYALISHLKQFVFAFHHTILARVLHELKHGNYAPAMALTSYVPVMIAVDTIKGVLQGGGDTPEWKKNWDMTDYVGYGVQRAGLLGVGQFGFDVASDIGQGGTGIGALSGPTIEQIGDIMQTAGGRMQFGSTVIDAMPANALYKEAVTGGSASEPMHSH